MSTEGSAPGAFPQGRCREVRGRSKGLWFVAGLVALGGISLLSLFLGAAPVSPPEVWEALFGPEPDAIGPLVVRELRFPRLVTALLAGASLGAAGLLLQALFRNPLADPFVLGVSSGAGLGVGLLVLGTGLSGVGLLAGVGLGSASATIVAGALGAGSVLVLVLFLSNRVGLATLLILGLMIGYLAAAVLSVLMFLAGPEKLQAFLYWTYGSFDGVGNRHLALLAGALFVGLGLGWSQVKSLDALQSGEDVAAGVGVAVRRTRILVLAAASVLAGAVTAFCGPIGFLGIAVPHLCRGMLDTGRLQVLYPAVLLCGAVVAASASLLATLPGLERVLPLNAVTALIGVPVVIRVLLREGGSVR